MKTDSSHYPKTCGYCGSWVRMGKDSECYLTKNKTNAADTCANYRPYPQKESVANSENVVYNDGGEAWMANVLCDEEGDK